MRKLSKLQKRRTRRLITVALVLAVLIIVGAMLSTQQFDVLGSKGTIAAQQRDLLIFTAILSLAIIIPVYLLAFVIVRKYRIDAKKPAQYTPEWDGNRKLEILWWGIPGLIILVLSAVTWQTSHSLDPFRAIQSSKPPLDVQVVALQWKCLFIYPEQGIASVNYVQFPKDRPVRFSITSDAPMNAFWIPRLGGMVYAMSGMSTQLNLQANGEGSYRGVSSNLSGDGFADMNFTAQSVSQESFDVWARMIKQQSPRFGDSEYQLLVQPSTPKQPTQYRLTDQNLYNQVVAKYMNQEPTTTEARNAATD